MVVSTVNEDGATTKSCGKVISGGVRGGLGIYRSRPYSEDVADGSDAVSLADFLPSWSALIKQLFTRREHGF